MAERSGIDHRYSSLTPDRRPDSLDIEGFFRRGAFPATAARMRRYVADALELAARAFDGRGGWALLADVTHIVLPSCTAFFAPGLELQLMALFRLPPSTDPTRITSLHCSPLNNSPT